MVLHLEFLDCELCSRLMTEMRVEDSAESHNGELFCFRIPRERFRRRIAPTLCDGCWFDFAHSMWRRRWGRTGRGDPPPFRQIYLWEWVARELESKARRMLPHFKAKAQRGVRRLDRLR